ncbi:putative ribonuclease H-like domain-containing protein, partial [Tanacetum coccineum]
KSAFLYGKIEEEVYVCQPPGFEDPDFHDRVYKVEKAFYGLHQAPRAWYETVSTYLLNNGFQRGKIDKTLFIIRDKGDILLVQYVACANDSNVNPKSLHLFAVNMVFKFLKGQPKIRPLVISWQCKKQTMVANSTTEVEYIAASNYCGQGKDFFGRDTPLFPTMIVQAQEQAGDLSQRVLDLEKTKTSQAVEITKLKEKVKKLEKKGESRTHMLRRLYKVGRSLRVFSSEDEGLGDQEDVSKQRRKIDEIDQDADVTLVDET